MSQNSMRYSWTAEEVDQKLSQIMKDIHDTCVKFGKEGDKIDYVKGANIGGFIKVAEAMCAQGHVQKVKGKSEKLKKRLPEN